MSDDDESGKTRDRTTALEPPIDFRGLDQEVVTLLNQVYYKKNPVTGTVERRDLSQITEAVEVLDLLEKAAEFTKETASAANLAARRLYEVISKSVKEVAPELGSIIEKRFLLGIARDAFQKVNEQYLTEKSRYGRPVVYWGAALGLCFALRVVGILPVAAVGAAVALWAFGRSTLYRTSLAAWLSKRLEKQEAAQRLRQQKS
jgi:hypothetical protein